MNNTFKTLSQVIYDYVMNTVVRNENSPYSLLRQRVDDIDIIDIGETPGASKVLPDYLSLDLKDEVVMLISQECDKYFCDKKSTNELIAAVQSKISESAKNANRSDIGRVLNDVRNSLEKYSESLLTAVHPSKYSEVELKEKYEKAKKITIIERITGNNVNDVIEFHRTLTHYTYWTCRYVIKKRTADYLNQIAQEIVKIPNCLNDEPVSENTPGKDGYIPHPFDLSKVTLPEDIQSKVETIAKNIHEVWAEKRISEGWRYGTTRDDEHKFHPCLCRYEDLPESEKEYDRTTVEVTLKSLYHSSIQIRNEKKQ